MLGYYFRFSPRRAIYLAVIFGVAVAAIGYVRYHRGHEIVPDAAEGALHADEIRLLDAIHANPGSAALRLELAQIYLKLEDYPAVEAEVQRAAENGASDDAVAPLRAQALLREGKFPLLLKTIDPGHRPAKAEAQVRTALGIAHLERQELPQAQELLEDAERLDPQAVDARVGMVRLLLAQKRRKAAAEDLARAAKLAPDDPDIVRLEAEFAWQRGEAAAALARLDALVKSKPGDLKARALRADILIGESKFDDAQRDLAVILKAAPRSITGNYLDALIWAMKGDMTRANNLLTTVNEGFAPFPAGYYLQGVVRYELGYYDLANTSLSFYIAARPGDARARRLLGAVALRLQDPGRAITLLRPIAAADPRDIDATTWLAQAFVANRDRDTAMQWLFRSATALAAHGDADKTQPHANGARAADRETARAEGILDAHRKPEFVQWLPALAQMQSGALSKAAATIDAAVTANGSDDVARDIQGIIRFRLKDYAAAEAIFKAIIRRDPDFLEPRRNLARLYAATHHSDKAKAVWLALLYRTPGDVGSLMALAEIDVAEGNRADAIERLSLAQQTVPNDPRPSIDRLALLAAQSDKTAVAQAAQDLVSRFPERIDVIAAAAAALAGAGNRAAANQLFERFIAAHPSASAAFDRYAALRLDEGDANGARALLVRALETARDAQHLQALVDFDRKAKGVEAALATAQAYAEKLPVAAAWVAAGILADAHRVKDATDMLVAALAAHPASALVIRLAQLETASGDVATAQARLEAWVATHSNDTLARIELAQVYLRQSKDDEAQRAYEAILARSPDTAIALNNLAWLYLKKSDRRARALAERAYGLAPTPQTMDTYGWVLTNEGNAASGLPFLREAAAATPNDAGVEYHLAVALNATGAVAAARALLERVLQSTVPFDGREAARRLLKELARG